MPGEIAARFIDGRGSMILEMYLESGCTVLSIPFTALADNSIDETATTTDNTGVDEHDTTPQSSVIRADSVDNR